MSLLTHFGTKNKRGLLSYIRVMYYTGKDFVGGDQWPVQSASKYYLNTKKMNTIRFGVKWEATLPISLR